MDSVELYEEIPGQGFRPRRAGDLQPYSQRELDFDTFVDLGYTMNLPVNWQSIDVYDEGIDSSLRKLSRIDDDWSESESWLLEDEDTRDSVVLLAREDNPKSVLNTSLRLFTYSFDGTIRSRDLCDKLREDYDDNDDVALKEVRCGLDINGMDGARFDVQYIYNHYDTREITYYYIQGKYLWVMEFHVLDSQLDQYKDIIDTIGGSFDAAQPKPVS